MKLPIAKISVAILSLSLSSCTNLSFSSMFSDYSSALRQTHSLVKTGNYQQALDSLPTSPFGDLLDNLERGRLAMLAGEREQSQLYFEQADKLIESEKQKAIISISDGFNQAGSLLVNDNMRNYFPSDYELGFLYLYRALNFLQQKDLSAALVEIRRANQVQEQAIKLRKDALLEAEKSLKEQNLQENIGAILSRYPKDSAKLSTVQNAYLFYLSGLLYETESNLNSAFIDYSRGLAVSPENQYIAQALMRVAKRQGRKDELRRLEKKYGKLIMPIKEQGQLVVFIERGVIQPKSGWRLPFYYFSTQGSYNTINLALPYYQQDIMPRANHNAPLMQLETKGNKIDPSLLLNTNSMAKNALAEQMPAIATRQILRLVVKNELKNQIKKQDETGIAELFANVYNVLSEQPDTRSWQSLPEQINLFSQYYPEGEQEISLAGQQISIKINAKKTTMLWLSIQGDNYTYWQDILGEL